MRTLVEDLVAVCLCCKGHAWIDNEHDYQALSSLTA
jgi:hypothetical protein